MSMLRCRYFALQMFAMFHELEQTMKLSDILKQGIKLFVYTALALHLGACFLHITACYSDK